MAGLRRACAARGRTPRREPAAPTNRRESFDGAAADVQQQLEESLAELDAAARADRRREDSARAAAERARGRARRKCAQRVPADVAVLDSRTLDLSNLRKRDQGAARTRRTYLSNLLSEYMRELRVAPAHRRAAALRGRRSSRRKLAPENSNLSEQDVFAAQVGAADAVARPPARTRSAARASRAPPSTPTGLVQPRHVRAGRARPRSSARADGKRRRHRRAAARLARARGRSRSPSPRTRAAADAARRRPAPGASRSTRRSATRTRSRRRTRRWSSTSRRAGR